MFTKENIINRMFKYAMNYLGIKKIENLDPLIKLLMEGLAAELFSIVQEIEDSNRRVMEKVAQLLIPDLSFLPIPSHGIAHIRSQRLKHIITKETGIYCEQSDKGSGTITFYPVTETCIYDGDVRRIIYNRNIYDINDAMIKNHIAHVHIPETFIMKRTLWLGLELSLNLDKIESLTFFFNLPIRNDRQKLYSLLAYTKWSIDDIPLTCTPKLLKNSAMEDIFEIYDTETTFKKDILASYANQFYSVEWNMPINGIERRFMPKEFDEYYPEQLHREQKKLYWFKMELPQQFDPEAIEDLEIYINAVIIENKYLNTLSTHADDKTEIIPLNMKPGHSFLSMREVTDASNRLYRNIPRKTEENQERGLYVIRHGGCERLNASELKDLLYRQMDLIYDHSALISTTDRNMFFTQMSRIHESFGIIDKNFSKIDSMVPPHSYLIVDTLRNAEILYVSFWSTLCEAANNIIAGTPMSLLKESSFIDKNIVLLTTTKEGKSKQKIGNSFTTYNYLLATRDRIFTEYDIISYCKKELNDILISVDLKKGFIKSGFPGEGLVRTIDIFIKTHEEVDVTVLEDLKKKLTVRSPSSFYYRIFLTNKQMPQNGN